MADSEREGKGLPRSDDPGGEAGGDPASAVGPRGPTAGGAYRPRVLVVDDQDLIRQTLAHGMAHSGAEVVGCATAEEALDALATRFFDLCFLDLRLPGMDGLEAMAEIRRRSPRTQIALMTASYLGDQEGPIRQAADYFLAKPFDLNEAREIAGQVLGLPWPSRP